VTDEIVCLDATEEEEHVIAQANAELDPKTSKLKGPQVLCRSRDGECRPSRPRTST
jgi:DNA-directed RNA polymerase subunit beta